MITNMIDDDIMCIGHWDFFFHKLFQILYHIFSFLKNFSFILIRTLTMRSPLWKKFSVYNAVLLLIDTILYTGSLAFILPAQLKLYAQWLAATHFPLPQPLATFLPIFDSMYLILRYFS